TVTHLEVKFTCASSDPPPTQHEVSTSSRCVTVHVPSDAETILVKDLDGPSPDKTAIVQSA
ncbi:MAG TPA: hypothetical protein VK081_05880, partial [Planctomycetota bacterium]|nr:hypothetical protein [Planctomycetota bacterium]